MAHVDASICRPIDLSCEHVVAVGAPVAEATMPDPQVTAESWCHSHSRLPSRGRNTVALGVLATDYATSVEVHGQYRARHT